MLWKDIIAERGELGSDMAPRELHKFDVYYCAGEPVDDKSTLLGKDRPFVIVQSQNTLNPFCDQVQVAPIRSYGDSGIEFNDDMIDEFVKEKEQKGRLIVPCCISPGKYSFIDITQSRPMLRSKMRCYKGNIQNKIVRNEINRVMFNFLFGTEDIIVTNNCSSKEPVEKHESIDTENIQQKVQIEEPQPKPKEKPKNISKKQPTSVHTIEPPKHNTTECFSDEFIKRYNQLGKGSGVTITKIAAEFGWTYNKAYRMVQNYGKHLKHSLLSDVTSLEVLS